MTSIQWTDETWNPVRGCSRVSEGCRHCYAERQAARFAGPGQPYQGLVRVITKERILRRDFANGDVELRKAETAEPHWTGDVRFAEDVLGKPLSWKRPRLVFVNSMSDLFHEKLSAEQIAAVFGVMAACPQHTFQVLTKRPVRLLSWFEWASSGRTLSAEHLVQQHAWEVLGESFPLHQVKGTFRRYPWPLPNVWLGVSCEDQETADLRIPLLLQTPAALRFVSCEPLLGPIDLGLLGTAPAQAVCGYGYVPIHDLLRWVIVGGESGPCARRCELTWVRSIAAQCREAGVPCFVKQLGRRPLDVNFTYKDRAGGDPKEWPADLRVREWPPAEGGAA